jgi:hypothetical protein
VGLIQADSFFMVAKGEYAFPIMLEASAKGQEIYQDLQSDPDVVIQNDGSVKDSSQNQMNVDRFGISNMHETKGDETANSHNGGYEKRLSESNGLYSQKSSEKFGLDDHQEPFAESYAPQFFAALAGNFPQHPSPNVRLLSFYLNCFYSVHFLFEKTLVF